MRSSPALRGLAAAAALACAGRAAADVNVGGSATFGYAHQDFSNSVGDQASADSYDWGAALSLDGMPFRPGLLSWSASGSYAQHRNSYGGVTAGRNGLGYGLSLSLLDGKPLWMSLSANRGRTEFTEGGGRSGTTLVGTEVAGVVLAIPDMPRLTAQLVHVETSNQGFGAETKDESLSLRAGLNDHVGPIHYGMEYGTAWNLGTLAQNNYRTHSLGATALGDLSDGYVSFGSSYLLRLPTVESPLNPRFDDETFSGSFHWRGTDKLLPAVAYSYHRALISAPDTPAREGTSHALSQSLEYRYRPNLRLTETLSVTYSAQRLGPDEAQVAAESLGGAVSWNIPVFPSSADRYTLNLGAGTSAGLVQGDGPNRVSGYSVGGGASLNRWAASGTAQISYNVSYADALSTAGGRQFAHDVRLEADTNPSSRLQLRMTLLARSARRTSDLLGSSADRSISAIATAQWAPYTFSLSAGLSDGLSPGVRDLGLADGLVWAPDYDMHSQFATAAATARFGAATLTTLASYVHSSGAGRLDDQELALSASLGYTVGLFQVTAEDHYSTGGSGGVTRSGNVFMVRLSRSFGWHF